MRAWACTIFCTGAILIAAPAWAAEGRYDPKYPVCMEAAGAGGSRIECVYTSIEQCREGTFGSSGTCFNNPSYVPRPAEAAPAQTDPEPAKPRKSAGRYDPDYPVCMETAAAGGSSAECIFMSYEQCRQGTFGSSASCFNNPNYVPPPAGAAPLQIDPEPPKPRKSVGRYDPDYPVCMDAVGNGGGRIECFYTSYEQCRQATFGSSGTCFKNPSYVPPPVEAAPAPTEPAPPAKPVKSAKLAKSVKSAKSQQLPPSPQPAQPAPSQQR
jgi:hypothetical protein